MPARRGSGHGDRQLRIGVDIGGTFTDFVVRGSDGGTHFWKQETTPAEPDRAVRLGLAALAEQHGNSLEEFLGRTGVFVHGSTIATNTIIERDGPTVGLVTTEGFRDVLYFRDGFKWDRYDPRLERPDDLVDRHLRTEVRERIGPGGEIITPLDPESVHAAADHLRTRGVDAVAVALLWSHVNQVHEIRVREILNERLGGIPVLISSAILPNLGEWVRTSATVLSAYVYRESDRYLSRLRDWLGRSGLRVDPLIMQVNGGCSPIERIMDTPVNLIHSGPAAAPVAALDAGDRTGSPDVIVADMGGTSFDVTLIAGREIPRTRFLTVARQPIGVSGVEVHSVGAGGGSVAWIDPGGALRVGPRSAGASPGPAAYGAGGSEPTVTDANVVLGRLSETAFLGGRQQLQRDLAERAIRERIAIPLGIGVEEAALGIIRIVNESMASAIRVVSVERGIDPRPFLLVAAGGACALHATELARELAISRVVIPAESGVLSASGMVSAEVRQEYSGVLHTDSADPDLQGVASLLSALEDQARQALQASGFKDSRITMDRTTDARYSGQVHELTIDVPEGEVGPGLFDATVETFHADHHERFGWNRSDYPVEFLHWRVAARGLMQAGADRVREPVGRTPVDPALAGVRQVRFDDPGGPAETPVFDASLLRSGMSTEGPAVVDSATTTVLLQPGDRLTVNERMDILIDLPR